MKSRFLNFAIIAVASAASLATSKTQTLLSGSLQPPPEVLQGAEGHVERHIRVTPSSAVQPSANTIYDVGIEVSFTPPDPLSYDGGTYGPRVRVTLMPDEFEGKGAVAEDDLPGLPYRDRLDGTTEVGVDGTIGFTVAFDRIDDGPGAIGVDWAIDVSTPWDNSQVGQLTVEETAPRQ